MRQELAVVYQLVIDLRTGHVRAHEALLQWTHRRRRCAGCAPSETGVLTQGALARSLASVREERGVVLVRAPQEPDGRRTIARLLRSVTEPGDTIGAWGCEVLVVVRAPAASSWRWCAPRGP